MTQATLLYRCYDQTGEAATWLPARRELLWVDIDNGILHRYRPDNGTVKDHAFPDTVTSVIPWQGHDDKVILTMKDRLIAFHLANATYSPLAELPGLSPGLRTNDCKASPEGRLWCGVMHMSEHHATGCLYRMEKDLALAPVLRQQHIPNGIVWNRAGDRMFYADSGRGCIEEYAYSPETGEIRFLRTAVRVSPQYGVPDGMTIDANGFLWVAHWGGGGVYVWNPATGRLEDKVEVAAPNVASCTFGGKEGRQLFITTALSGLTDGEKEKWPLSGSLFTAEIPGIVPGENHYPFITDK